MNTTAADIAARMETTRSAATGNWYEAAEQIAALNADNLYKFHGELGALYAMTLAEIRTRKGP